MRIFLDTDIGTNIDDSFALVYLLKKAKESLIGVSTVSGDTGFRAKIAGSIIADENFQIPVMAGNEKPLFGKHKHGSTALFNEPFGSHSFMGNISGMKPWDFLAEKVTEFPGQIDVICIGPLTNLAIFSDKFPDQFQKLRSIRMMSGIFRPVENYHKKLETNANYDPHALKNILLKAGFPIYMVGVDVTINTRCDFDAMESILQDSGYETLFSQLIQFKSQRNVLILHDLLVAVSLFEDIIKYDAGNVKVELLQLDRMGETTYLEEPGNYERYIAVDIDVDKFWQEIETVLFDKEKIAR